MKYTTFGLLALLSLNLWAAGVTDETWGEAWNSKIGKANFTVTSPSTWCQVPWKRGNCACMFDNSNSTSSDFLCNKPELPVWVKLVIADSYEPGKDVVLKKYRMIGGSDIRMPKAWKIYGAASADAEFEPEKLVLISERTGVTGTTSVDVDCSVNAAGYRTYFVWFEANNGDSLLQVPELYLFGEVKEHEEVILFTATVPYVGLYDGYAHTVTVEPYYPAEGVTVEYSADGVTWGATAPMFKKIGEYELHYRLTADGFPTVTKVETISIREPPQQDVDVITAVRAAERSSGETLHALEATDQFFNSGNTYENGSPENFIDGLVMNGNTQQRGGWAGGTGTLTYEISEAYRPGDAVVVRGVSFASGTTMAFNNTALCMPRNWKLEAFDVATSAWVELVSFTGGVYPEWTDADVITREGTDCYYRETAFANETAYRKYRLTILGGRTHVAEIGLLGDIVMADDSVISALGINYRGTYDGQPHGILLKVTNPSEGYAVSYRVKGEESWSAVNPTFVEPIPASQPKVVEWKVEADGFETVSGESTVVIDYQDLTALVRTEAPTARAVSATSAFYASGCSVDSFVDGNASQRNGWTNGGAFEYEFLQDFHPGEALSVRSVRFATNYSSAKDGTKIVMPRTFTVSGWNEEIGDWVELAAFTSETVSEWTDDDLQDGIYCRTFDLDNPFSFRKYRIAFPNVRAHVGEISLLGVAGGAVVKQIVCSGADYEGVYDGAAHGIAVEVRAPAEGATVWYRWGDRRWTTEAPLFKGPVSEEGSSRMVFWKVVADGYRTVEGANTVTIPDQPHEGLDIMAEVHAAGTAQGEDQFTIDACVNAGGFGDSEGPLFFNGKASDRLGWTSANGKLAWTIKDTFRPGERIVVNGIGFAGLTGGNIVINNGQIMMPTAWTFEGSVDGETWTAISTCTESPAWGEGDIRPKAEFGTSADVYYRRIDFANTTAYRHYRFVFPASRVQISEIYLYGSIGHARRERLPGLGFSVIVR